MTSAASVLAEGEVLAGYRIVRHLGSGSFGHVYLADELNPQLQRTVALKVLREEFSADPGFRERFFRESRLVARLDAHPAIVSVFDAGQAGGSLWIATRFVEGTDLRAVLDERGRLPLEVVVGVVERVGGALDVAHEAGVVHRDVKPANILLTRDLTRAYLADFGMSKNLATGVDDSITRAGQFVGTIRYAAPEQLGGGKVSGRSDTYALACVAFEMLAGRAPFEGTLEAVMAGHLLRDLPDLRELVPGLPVGVASAIRTATDKQPERRHPTAGTFAGALRRSLPSPAGGASIHAPPPSRRDPPAPAPPPMPFPAPASVPASVVAPPERQGARMGSVLALALGLPVLLAALIGGWCLLSDACGVGSQRPPTPVTTEPPPETESLPPGAASAEQEQLRGFVPPPLETGCSDVVPEAASVGALNCTPPAEAAADVVTYDLYATTEDLVAAYADLTAQLGVLPDTVGRCPSEGPWTEGELQPGRMVCGLLAAGGVVVGWTDERLLVAAVAFNAAGDSEALLGWWEGNEGGPLLP